MSKPAASEPYWQPLQRQRLALVQTTGIVVRQLIPVVGIIALGWSAGQFLLLSVFNICFSVVCIGVLGAVVSKRQQVGPSPNPEHEIGSWLVALAFALIGSVLLTAMFGWVIALYMVAAGDRLFDSWLAACALMMVASAAPALCRQYQGDLAAGLQAGDTEKGA
ncbi:MAG: hypothetical protein IPP82_07165 [Xanthomonadales bacterium]|nr:hypothetical protein [Xanthomonadales bacterium]